MNIQKLPIEGFTKVHDLIYYDGPFVSLFKDNDNNLYIMSWCDTNLTHHTWTISQVTFESLRQYQKKEISLRNIVLNSNNDCILVDIDDNLKYSNIRQVPAQEIPEEYIPSKKSYYNSLICINYQNLTPTFHL